MTTSDALDRLSECRRYPLTATDIGGTGVANTYYKLDGGAQTTAR